MADDAAPYPHLRAIIDGRVSGTLSEWPLIRPELAALFAELARTRAPVSAPLSADVDLCRHLLAMPLPDHLGGGLCRQAAGRIDILSCELAEMKRERQARNMIDPITRLHNLCDAMAEDRGSSPYSQEAWDLQDQVYNEKCRELDAANLELAQLRTERDAAQAALDSARTELQRYHASEAPGGWTEELNAQIQARHRAEEDADRYRFLRSPLAGEAGVVQRELWAEMAHKLCREERMDAEVDAAMRLLKPALARERPVDME